MAAQHATISLAIKFIASNKCKGGSVVRLGGHSNKEFIYSMLADLIQVTTRQQKCLSQMRATQMADHLLPLPCMGSRREQHI